MALVYCFWWLSLKLIPPPDPYLVRPPGVRVLDRDGQLLRGFLSSDEKRRWRLELDEISPELRTAVLHHEDRWFYRHKGVNPAAVLRAAWGNLRAGAVTSGASTITMQLARLVEPQRRTFGAKIHQAWRALQYESLYSKDQILTMYLNLAPYGGNVEGVGAASQVWFGKPARELSWAEACQLAVLPQSPLGHDPILHPDSAREARNDLAQRLFEDDLITKNTKNEIHSREVPKRRQGHPFLAPHFSQWTLGRHPGQVNLHTTLDKEMQLRAEEIVKGHARQWRTLGINQASVVVLDSRTGEIMTMVGSADFNDEDSQGQVNGAVAPRSPGSTLKPLLYTLAFDRGLTTVDALIEDVPRWFADYSPKNFDGQYSGAVKAGEALQRSLNVPAVSLAADLEKTEGGGLHQFLKDAEVNSLKHQAGHYGLTLVLGGGEVTLLELASLYGILARQGTWLPTRDLLSPASSTSKKVGPGRRLFGAGAAWLTLQQLTGVHRPDPEILWQNTTRQGAIPWKTGTSYGHRDAWSVGLAGPWVVAVWLGNFDGVGSPHLTGVEVAAPLFFDLIDGMELEAAGSWHQRPEQVAEHQVCSLSGEPMGEHCTNGVTGHFLPGISPASTCTIHRALQVDALSGYMLCSRCRKDHPIETKVVEWWPPQVSTYLAAGGMDLSVIPVHNPECPALGSGEAPVITNPQPDSEYYLRPEVPVDHQAIALEASFSAGANQVWWFVDGGLLQSAEPGEKVFYLPSAGRHHLTAVDDAGRSGSLDIKVIGSGNTP